MLRAKEALSARQRLVRMCAILPRYLTLATVLCGKHFSGAESRPSAGETDRYGTAQKP